MRSRRYQKNTEILIRMPKESSWLAVSAKRGLKQFLPPNTQNWVLSGPPLISKEKRSLKSCYPCSFFQTLYVMHSELLLKGPSLIALCERVTPLKAKQTRSHRLERSATACTFECRKWYRSLAKAHHREMHARYGRETLYRQIS